MGGAVTEGAPEGESWQERADRLEREALGILATHKAQRLSALIDLAEPNATMMVVLRMAMTTHLHLALEVMTLDDLFRQWEGRAPFQMPVQGNN